MKRKTYLMTLNHCSPTYLQKKAVNYVLDQIYVHNTLPQICSRLIFKGLVKKLATELTFTFNNKVCKDINGCTMGRTLPVTLSIHIYIYMYIYIYIYIHIYTYIYISTNLNTSLLVFYKHTYAMLKHAMPVSLYQ